jgi:hypothetical protein
MLCYEERSVLLLQAHKAFVHLLALKNLSYMRPLRGWNSPVNLIPSTIWPWSPNNSQRTDGRICWKEMGRLSGPACKSPIWMLP